jgi:hypothetical protein
MIVPGSANALLLSQGGYQIANSLRFRASNSAYIRRTIGASSTSTTVATWSFWIKRGAFAAARQVIVYNGNTAGTGNTIQLEFTSGSAILAYFNGAGTTGFTTNAVFRDPSAWYHVVLAYDSTQATDSNRAKLYVNGTQITSFSSVTYPALNQAFNAGSGDYQQMMGFGATLNTDGYMANVYFIDGQALTPSSFGQTDATTGVWVPKAYSGTYGTNGFFLQFKDATSTTTIGYDTSGNSNNFTTSGISVTAGGTFDQSLDTPTLNYPVISPLNSQSVVSITEAGMASNYGGASNTGTCIVSVPFPTTGKWYYEHTCLAVGAYDYFCGVFLNKSIAGNSGNIVVPGTSSNEYAYQFTGSKMIAGVVSAYGSSYTANDVIGVAFDAANLTIEFFKNNVSQGQLTGMPSGEYIAFTEQYGGGSTRINFGQRPFAYTPPTNFKALNTANLSVPTIKKPSLYMNATLRTGTGATASVSSLSFQPDLVWTKSRSAATNNNLFDSVRGVQNGIVSNSTAIEYSDANTLTAFNSNGYTYGSDASSRGVNINTNTYVDWVWKKGVTPGFDIVTWTADGTSPRNISHSLGAVPKFIITKQRSPNAENWFTYHSEMGATKNLRLDESVAAQTQIGAWNDTAPTSTQFTTGNFANFTTNGNTLVAYLFAEISGFSKFGSYVGNSSSDGPFVWCGFRPKWIFLKGQNIATSWRQYDAARMPNNEAKSPLYFNAANAESAEANGIDILSNGFKLRWSDNVINGSGSTYIFAAFAEAPFKYARAR